MKDTLCGKEKETRQEKGHTLNTLYKGKSIIVSREDTWGEAKRLILDPPVQVLRNGKGMLSLLHLGWEVDTWGVEEEIDRIVFYLDIADKYHKIEVFAQTDIDRQSIYHNYGSPAKAKQDMACRAFKVLCEKFFKSTAQGKFLPIANEEIFAKLLWFFRRNEEGYVNGDNLNPFGGEELLKKVPQRYLEIANEFAKEFCRWAWPFNSGGRFFDGCHGEFSAEQRKTIEARLRGSVIQITDLMERLQMLDYISGDQYLPDWGVYKILEQHVLGSVFRLPIIVKDKTGLNDNWSKRKPENLEEAVLASSALARVLLIVRAKLEVKKKFSEAFES